MAERKTGHCASCKRRYTNKNPQVEKSNRCSKCSTILHRAYLNWESLRQQGNMNLSLDLHRERAIEILQTIASFDAPLPTRMYDFKNLS